MRRRQSASLLSTLLLVGLVLAGCSGTRDGAGSRPSTGVSASAGAASTPAPGGGSAPDPTPTGTATGNAADVCTEARKVSSDQVSRFLAELGDALTASGDGDQAGAAQARRAAADAIRAWSAGLRAQADRADDPRLAGLLRDMAAEVGTMTADIDSIDDARLDQLQQRLDQLCGG